MARKTYSDGTIVDRIEAVCTAAREVGRARSLEHVRAAIAAEDQAYDELLLYLELDHEWFRGADWRQESPR